MYPTVTIDAEENMELARRYGVMQAPTLVVVNGDSHKKVCKCFKYQEVR